MNNKPVLSLENTETAFAGKSDSDLRQSYRIFKLLNHSILVETGAVLANLALKFYIPISPFARPTVFRQFCGGESLEDCKPMIEKMENFEVKVLLNYGMEGAEREVDFDSTISENVRALQFAGSNKNVIGVSLKLTGIGRFELYEKLQSRNPLNMTEMEEFSKIKTRIALLCKTAAECQTSIYLDAEESWVQETLDDLVNEMMAKYNKEKCIVFTTFQIYRHDKLEFLKKSLDLAKRKGYILGAKLVRGAYLEKENERAAKLGYPSPIHESKYNVNRDYNESIDFCLENLDHIAACFATHNEESCEYLAQKIKHNNIAPNHPHITVAQLFGMGEHITFNLAKTGMNAIKYIPYGPVRKVIPYLIRRAEENSSVVGQMGRELNLIKKEIDRRKKVKKM